MSDKEYEVEVVRGRDWNSQFGCYNYYIKWKNYDEEWNEWLPANAMACDELIEEFNVRCEKVFRKDMRTSKKKIMFGPKGKLSYPANVKKKSMKAKRKRNRAETDDEMEVATAGSPPAFDALSTSNATSAAIKTDQTSDWELEEEEEPGFVYDPFSQEFKMVDDGESGFDRKWELEKIVVLVNGVERPDGSREKCAIIKFRKYKYAQRIVLSKVLHHAKEELMTFLADEFLRSSKV